jgi:hypothetical protein
VIEVLHFCFRERLAEDRHNVLPLPIADHRKSRVAGEMFDIELDFPPIAAASQPWKPVKSNRTRNFRRGPASRSNSGTNCS